MTAPKLASILKTDNMLMDLSDGDKSKIIESVIDNFVKTGTLTEENGEKAKAAVLKRESLGSTGIGNGIAIPHAMIDFSDEFICGYGHVPAGMNYGALDGDDVYAIFLLLSPENCVDQHLGIMKELASFSREPLNFNFLKTCASSDSVIDLLGDWKTEGA